MKHRLTVLTILAILFLTAGASAPAAGGETDKLELRFHFQKGQIYRLMPTVEEKNFQILDGAEQVTTSVALMGQTLEVLAVHEDGSATIKVTFGPTAIKNEGPQGAYAYDSTNPPDELPMPALAVAFVVGKSYTVTMTPAGEIVEMQGVDAFLDAMVEALPNDDNLRANMRQSFRHQFGEDGLKDLLGNATAFFPGKAVAVGDSWTRKVVHSRGMPRIVETTYTLAARDDGVATVELKATTKPDPDAKPIKTGPVSMRHTVEGTQTGTYKVDEATGFILEGEITHELQGELILSNVPNREGDLTIPTRVEIKVTIETSLDQGDE